MSQYSRIDMKIAAFHELSDSHQPMFLPLSWAAAFITTSIWPLHTGTVPILLPASWKQPCSPDRIYEALQHIPKGKRNGVFLVPDVLREYIRKPEHLESLKRFDTITYGGAGLDRDTGDAIWEKTGLRIHSAMGSTDSSVYPLLYEEKPSSRWWMYRFHPNCLGFYFEHFSDDLYELCIKRQPNDNRHCFLVDPERKVFHTRDLFKTVRVIESHIEN